MKIFLGTPNMGYLENMTTEALKCVTKWSINPFTTSWHISTQLASIKS